MYYEDLGGGESTSLKYFLKVAIACSFRPSHIIINSHIQAASLPTRIFDIRNGRCGAELSRQSAKITGLNSAYYEGSRCYFSTVVSVQ